MFEGLDKQIENLKLQELNQENDVIKFPKSKSMPEPDEAASAESGSSPCPGWPNTGKKTSTCNFAFLPAFITIL